MGAGQEQDLTRGLPMPLVNSSGTRRIEGNRENRGRPVSSPFSLFTSHIVQSMTARFFILDFDPLVLPSKGALSLDLDPLLLPSNKRRFLTLFACRPPWQIRRNAKLLFLGVGFRRDGG